jgi:hypothetical protein
MLKPQELCVTKYHFLGGWLRIGITLSPARGPLGGRTWGRRGVRVMGSSVRATAPELTVGAGVLPDAGRVPCREVASELPVPLWAD